MLFGHSVLGPKLTLGRGGGGEGGSKGGWQTSQAVTIHGFHYGIALPPQIHIKF